MEKHQESLQKAKFQYDAAFHLLTITYPFLKDPKLLIAVLSNIHTSMEYALDALLSFERQLQLVPHYLDNFQSKFNVFQYKSVRRNKIEPTIVRSMEMVQTLLNFHQRSLIEFHRQDKLVICDKEFEIQQVSPTDIRNYLDASKALITIAEKIISIERNK